MDVARLRASWRSAEALGDSVPEYFYAALFVASPDLRELFPASMSAQRDRLFAALGRIVSSVDDSSSLVTYLHQMGADHRRFDVDAKDYPVVGAALLTTLAHFLGETWTEDLAADWGEAYQLVAAVMQEGAAAAAGRPPVWNAEVITHRRTAPDIAFIEIAPYQPYPYRSGQSVPLESPLRPKVWRYYSPASAPRADGSLELHVRAVPGGDLSPALVYSLAPHMVVHLGAPTGVDLSLDPTSNRPLLLVAGGTGLAPLRSLIDELAVTARKRRTTLILGARTARDLYDLPALNRFAERHDWLTVIPVVAGAPQTPEYHGSPAEALPMVPGLSEHEAYVCGPPGMVGDVKTYLATAGIPDHDIHSERAGSPTAPVRAEVLQPDEVLSR